MTQGFPDIKEFHAHVYYDAETRPSAIALHDEAVRRGGSEIMVSTPSDGPRGPHVRPMFGIHMPPHRLAEIVGWLMQAHGPHSVLIHPETGDDLMDHTHHATWLGQPQPLNLYILRRK